MFGLFSKSKKPAGKKKSSAGKKKAGKKSSAAPSNRDSTTEKRQQIQVGADGLTEAQSKLDQASARLANGEFKPGGATADRKKLIEQALAVHKVQSKLLDELDDNTKQKLRTLAMEKMFAGKLDE